MLKIEKRLIIGHVILFAVCAICRVYCQINIEDWYYRYQFEELYMWDLVLAKPLFYYSIGFLATFFLARKAFRDDLALPYKLLGIVAAVLFILYLLAAGMLACVAMLSISPLPEGYYIALKVILDYYELLCIPGMLFGLAAEKRWKTQ